LSAVLRSAGFKAISLGKTQTPLDILRNSEELGVALVVPLLPSEGIDAHLRSFVEEVERGGFKTKFEIILVAPGLAGETPLLFKVARDSGEVISKATEWALKREGSLRVE
jgi:methylmalonyl-CoA mutase cobalamin-binding subunit